VKKPTSKKPAARPAKKAAAPAATGKKSPAKAHGEKAPAGKAHPPRTSDGKAGKAPGAKAPAAKAPAAKPARSAAAAATAEGKKPSPRKGARSVAEAASSASADERGYVVINGRRVRMISTGGRAAARRSAPESQSEAAPVGEQQPPRPAKTHLSRKQLNHYRNLLLIKRAELVGDLSSLEAEALRSSGGNLSHMPIHMADIGSDTYEQDFMLGLAETERRLLREIDAALQRIEDGSYGICQMTGEPIPDARLEAKPWASHTVEAARRLERGWA
jgi:RNA polymerase-binding protein DksA